MMRRIKSQKRRKVKNNQSRSYHRKRNKRRKYQNLMKKAKRKFHRKRKKQELRN